MKRCLFLRASATAAAILGSVHLLAADGIPPALVFVNPADGTPDVPRQSPVMFLFAEPMASTQSIAWSANVDPARFNYTWMEGTILMATYTPGFPANATITWTLNPTAGQPNNFRGADGDELPAGMHQGSFTTSSEGPVDPTDPCGNPVDDGLGAGFLSKQANYVQVGDNAPVLNAEQQALMVATYHAATNQNVTAVSISGPASLTLNSLFGSYNAFEQFDSVAALDSAFPAGNYTVNATGAGSATIALGSLATVPVPRINNLSAFAAMDVTKDFTLTFAPFTGAAANDYIDIQLNGDANGEFSAPDPCVPRNLPNTATSVVIPANTFKAGEEISGSISFGRVTLNTNSIPNTGVTAATGNTTNFELTLGGGGEPNSPMWTTITRNPDGTITYTVLGDTGLNIAIEASETLSGDEWTQVATSLLATGSFQFTINPATPNKRFYRARVL